METKEKRYVKKNELDERAAGKEMDKLFAYWVISGISIMIPVVYTLFKYNDCSILLFLPIWIISIFIIILIVQNKNTKEYWEPEK
jgi:hypothetical protein